LIDTFGPPQGTFQARKFVYLGNDLTPILDWLSTDAPTFSGLTNNLDDGAVRMSGFINVGVPGSLNIGTTSDDGSRITIGGVDVVNNDGSHGDATVDSTVFFAEAGLYPIEITYFNGDWTSDSTADGSPAGVNHSGNPDPAVHGGANFHLRVAGADITTNRVAMFFPPVIAPTVSVSRSGGSIQISFPSGFRLQRTTNLASPISWTDAATTSPFPVPPGTAFEFFRAISP
jgi:hypothetical protein